MKLTLKHFCLIDHAFECYRTTVISCYTYKGLKNKKSLALLDFFKFSIYFYGIKSQNLSNSFSDHPKNEIKIGRAYEIHLIVASHKSVTEITP